MPGAITEQTADSYAATFDTNVLGTLLSMKHELRVMLPQNNGSIVNISCTYGHSGAPGDYVYSASKHAVEGLTKSAALEVAGTGVRVNVIAPRNNRNTNAESLRENRRNKGWYGLERATKARGKPEENCSSYPFCFLRKSLLHHRSFLLVDGGKSAR